MKLAVVALVFSVVAWPVAAQDTKEKLFYDYQKALANSLAHQAEMLRHVQSAYDCKPNCNQAEFDAKAKGFEPATAKVLADLEDISVRAKKYTSEHPNEVLDLNAAPTSTPVETASIEPTLSDKEIASRLTARVQGVITQYAKDPSSVTFGKIFVATGPDHGKNGDQIAVCGEFNAIPK